MTTRAPIPNAIRDAQDRAYTVGYLVHLNKNEGAPDRLMGLVIPPFQRPPVWTAAQQSRFIESLWLGLPVGTYCVNRPRADLHFTDGWLLDGQQRIRAIAAFLKDEVAAFEWRWSEISIRDKRRFDNTPFGCSVVCHEDPATLLDVYNRLAYGGTAHT